MYAITHAQNIVNLKERLTIKLNGQMKCVDQVSTCSISKVIKHYGMMRLQYFVWM